MPNYVEFKHKESGLIVTRQQVDTILLNYFNVIHEDNPEEWYCDWYNCFGPLLAIGRSIDHIIKKVYGNDDEMERIGKALDSLFDIDSFYTG